MTPEQERAYEAGEAFREELAELLVRHLSKAGAPQTAILAALTAEATRGSYEVGLPLEAALDVVRTLYARMNKR